MSFAIYMLLIFSVFIRLKRKFFIVVLLASALGSTAYGQVPLLNDQFNQLDADQRIVFEWKVDAADLALSSGLAVSAEGLYRNLLNISGIGVEDLAELKIQLAASLIAQRRFIDARSLLETIPEQEQTDLYNLYLAVSVYGNGRNVDLNTFARTLDLVSVDKLKTEALPWFYLLKGLQAELDGRLEEVEPAFQKARSTAVSEAQRAFLDSLILREEIFNNSINEEIVAKVREQLDRLIGTPAAYPYVRQYAIILHNQGRHEEAIRVINDELANGRSGYLGSQREQLMLLKGLLYGVNSLSGRDVLRALVREGKSREVMAVALQLLASSTSALGRAELTDFLNSMIGLDNSHALLGQMYYIRSQLALSRAEIAANKSDARALFAMAEADARLLLEQFPGLSEITNVYRLLAYAALQRTPPQYRAAADFLIQLRDQTEGLEARRALNRLIGDCYFSNNDYRNAVDFYQAAQSSTLR